MFNVNNQVYTISYLNNYDSLLYDDSKGLYSLGLTDTSMHAIFAAYDIRLLLEQEEFICDFIATYADEINRLASQACLTNENIV